ASSSSTVTATEILVHRSSAVWQLRRRASFPACRIAQRSASSTVDREWRFQIGYRLRWQPVVEFSERHPGNPVAKGTPQRSQNISVIPRDYPNGSVAVGNWRACHILPG